MCLDLGTFMDNLFRFSQVIAFLPKASYLIKIMNRKTFIKSSIISINNHLKKGTG